ncbi:hypothetical protein [Paraburkholderia adhaesiva]|uniref:hypothetical protein n=1 Tax=Paraburkholderia adhaesiva TaxID=2883244 RepID=UPI001F1E4FA1|nr:hypothetical protein [Paraburkholderia adhaesiva]
MNTSTLPTTHNAGRGYYGTLCGYYAAMYGAQTNFGGVERDTNEAWALALRTLSAVTGESPEAVRAFLDGEHGQPFANDVLDYIELGQPVYDAVGNAAWRWQRHPTTQYRPLAGVILEAWGVA